MKTTEHPYNLHQKGLAYDKLKKQRDELLKICKLVMQSDIDGSFVTAADWWTKMKHLIKTCEND